MSPTDPAAAKREISIIIAALFSFGYPWLYPMLTGSSVIYWYPYWSSAAAIAYIAGGVLLQAGLCLYWRNNVTNGSLGAQVLVGFGYLVLSSMTGGPYLS